MFLSAFAASKPLVASPTSDPFWAQVHFVQTFASYAPGTPMSASLDNEKTEFSVSGTGGNLYESATITDSANVTFPAIQQVSSSSGVWLTQDYSVVSMAGPYTAELSFLMPAGASISSRDYAISTSHFLDAAFNVFHIFPNLYRGFFDGAFFTGNANQWIHLALVRNASNVIRVYVNGAPMSTTMTVSAHVETLAMPAIQPADFSATNKAIVSNIRFTKAARYSGNYTPTFPFPLQ